MHELRQNRDLSKAIIPIQIQVSTRHNVDSVKLKQFENLKPDSFLL